MSHKSLKSIRPSDEWQQIHACCQLDAVDESLSKQTHEDESARSRGRESLFWDAGAAEICMCMYVCTWECKYESARSCGWESLFWMPVLRMYVCVYVCMYVCMYV